MMRIGLTGGIGSGKSCVARILNDNGIPVFDCDSEARRLMTDGSQIRDELAEATGVDFFTDGTLDRNRLASFLFASSENGAVVNGIVHPKVTSEYLSWCEKNEADGCRVCAVESAILFGSGIEKYVDGVLVVDSPDSVRMRRALERDGTSEEKIRERMNAQLNREELLARADWVIDNSGNVDDLRREVEGFVKKIRN